MDKRCKCGRVFHLNDQKFIERDPGEIICKCGEIVHSWTGSRAWYVEKVDGLPEDEGQPQPFR